MEEDLKKIVTVLKIKTINPGAAAGNNRFDSKNYITSYSPIDGRAIAKVSITTRQEYDAIMKSAEKAFKIWREVPAPKRGEIVRQFGDKLRKVKEPLGKLVSLEMGKSLQEGLGEVQEMIDICDFAVGLSRQLHGFTMHSERPGHRMYEQYHPLGIVGVISAFNFPVAVWAWNATLAWVCGDVVLWKPSEKVPLCSVACQNIISKVLIENDLPDGISCIINGDYRIGQWMTEDERVPLVSATGSTRMGKKVGAVVAERLGRSLLELGGNNAIIISEQADLNIALTAAMFGAIGTAGQRCTSTRRLIIHESIYDEVKTSLKKAYAQVRIGSPLDESCHMGPLIDKAAVSTYLDALKKIKSQGGKAVVAGKVLKDKGFESACYVTPCIYEVNNDMPIVQDETFAPILYIMKYKTIEEAIAMQNNVRQGLSSAIMTGNLRESERFLSAAGSDCGIANVNIGTSGAEIGGAFGGEKETGGGRESGSDAWKVYMRRQTNTINYSEELPLAQGIKFEL
ncbi:MAG TPA: aldehyde dehydrogenase family protein [Flavobacteriales bacterium]|nr:aldehyde dehydrogenase family protein [Flavobacteriales bacterium]